MGYMLSAFTKAHLGRFRFPVRLLALILLTGGVNSAYADISITGGAKLDMGSSISYRYSPSRPLEILIVFSLAVRNIDNSELNNVNIDDLITLRHNDVNGSNISFDATIGSGKKVVTINLPSTLLGPQVVYVAIGSVETLSDNATSDTTYAAFNTNILQPSPLGKSSVTESIKASPDIPINFAQMNSFAIGNRVSWLSANSKPGSANKLSHQGIQFEFANPTLNKLMNIAYIKPGKLSPTTKLVELLRNNVTDGVPNTGAMTDDTKAQLNAVAFNEFAKVRENTIDKVLHATGGPALGDWNVWTEGKITVGKTYATNNTGEQKSKTQSISLGFDRFIKNDDKSDSKGHLIGVVLGLGKTGADIGTTATVDADSFSLSGYGVLNKNNKVLVEAMFGIGRVNVDKTRKDGADNLTGSHKANQVFSSLIFRKGDKELDDFKLSPYGKVFTSKTWYDGYSEAGGVTALIYGKQVIESIVLSVGADIEYLIPIHKGNIRPFAQLEYGRDISGSSEVNMHYNNETTNYQLSMDRKADHNWRAVLGADLYTKEEWDSSISYERTQAINSGHSNSLAVKVGLKF